MRAALRGRKLLGKQLELPDGFAATIVAEKGKGA